MSQSLSLNIAKWLFFLFLHVWFVNFVWYTSNLCNTLFNILNLLEILFNFFRNEYRSVMSRLSNSNPAMIMQTVLLKLSSQLNTGLLMFIITKWILKRMFENKFPNRLLPNVIKTNVFLCYTVIGRCYQTSSRTKINNEDDDRLWYGKLSSCKQKLNWKYVGICSIHVDFWSSVDRPFSHCWHRCIQPCLGPEECIN